MTYVIPVQNHYKNKSYKFKYLNEGELQLAVDKVRRERLKTKERETWNEFCNNENKDYSQKEINSDLCDSEYKIDNDEIKRYLFDYQNNDELALDESNKIPGLEIRREKLKRLESLSRSAITSLTLASGEIESVKEVQWKSLTEKLNSYFIKTRHIMEIIKYHINDFKIPDISGEIVRIQKKATEFCVRFSRNNLYQIELEYNNLFSVSNLNMEKVNLNKFKILTISTMLKINQYLFQAYLMLQRHMHIVWGYNGVAEKLTELLNFSIKTNVITRQYKDFINFSLVNTLDEISLDLIESIKHLLNVQNPLEVAIRFKKPMYSSRPMTTNSMYELKTKQNIYQKIQTNQNTKKRNTHSAMTHNQYYMYRNKTMNKTNLRCRLCDGEFQKKDNKSSIEQINQDFNKFGLNKSRQGSYHKNCHHGLSTTKPQIKKKIVPEKNGIKQKHITVSEDGKNLHTINTAIEEIHISDDDKDDVPEDIKEEIELNVQNDRLSEGSESKNVKLIVASHKSNENELTNNKEEIKNHSEKVEFMAKDTCSDKIHSKLNEDIRWDKIKRISDNILDEEISAVTSEMEAPLNQFIHNEVDNFSKFLFKTRVKNELGK